MAFTARCCILQLAATISIAWCKCQYSRWPDAPASRHFHRVCTSVAFAEYSSPGSAYRRCEVEVPLPPGKTLTVDTCEAVCNSKTECKGFVIRSHWSEKKHTGNCWLLYDKDLPRHSRSVRSAGKDRGKKTFLKEFCDCEARYVHVNRQSRRDVYQMEGAIIRLQKDLTNAGKSAADLSETLAGETGKREALLRKGGSTWSFNFFGDTEKSLARKIAKLEEELKDATRIVRAIERDIEGKQGDLSAEKARLGPLAELEGVDDIYQWFPMPPESQANMALNKIEISNVFLSEDKQKILYRCDPRSGSERRKSATRSNWYVVTFPQILKALQVDSLSDVSSMGTLQKVSLYLYTECLGFRLQGGGPGSRMCVGGRCLPMPTLSTDDPSVGCHKTAAKANAKREELVVAHMASEVAGGAHGEGAEAGAALGCPLTHDETSQKILEWAEWGEANPGYVSSALTAIQFAAYFTDSIDWSSGTTASYMRERLNLILKHFVPVIAAISTIDATEDMWVKIACSAVMLKGIQNMQGIFPKLAQNLAMRPDMIQDDYARDKLKETQSENPERPQADVEKFVEGTHATLSLYSSAEQSSVKEIPIFDAIKYKKLLAAGSVGQVLLYEVTSGDLRAHLRAEGVRDDMVILKVVFQETEDNYKSDWTLLEVFFSLAATFGDLGPLKSLWDFLRPMKDSIFNEFDLKVEGKNTAEGREMLHEFTKLVKSGEVEGLGGVKFTAPLTLATSSKYALIQSIASGTELKNYLIEAVGLPGTLTTWRQTIYRGVLHVYGFMAMSKGFFQADPHNGNWFVDDKSEKDIVVTLIDWGGVERLKPSDHCRLAEFYYRARAETQRYDRCSAVQVTTGRKLKRLRDSIDGEYLPAGLSVFAASEERELPSLLMGFSAAYKYKRVGQDGVERVLHFDGERWHLSEVCKGRDCATLYRHVLTYKRGQELLGDPRDPLSASQQEPRARSAGRWGTGVLSSGSLWIKRRETPGCKPHDNLAADKLNSARVVEAFGDLAGSLGLDPAPERKILNASLAVAAAAFDSDAALIARIGLQIYEAVQEAQLKNRTPPDLIPKIAPEWVLLVRCLAVFQGMLFDVLKQNIPPKLPQEYLEWFLDPSADKLFKYWAGYAERANVLDDKGKCVRGEEEESALVQNDVAGLDMLPPAEESTDVEALGKHSSSATAPTVRALGPGVARHLLHRAADMQIERH